MPPAELTIRRVYLTLLFFQTLASSLIWGINTMFLLDAGLSNTQAFLANGFFTLGQVLFEVPTGVVADLRGRRVSYLLGTVTLAVSTIFYLLAWNWHAGMEMWLVTSLLLGLGFTFFSGATEAWLVDALKFTQFEGELDAVFAKGQVTSGAAMLIGSVGGGFLAQISNLGVPYVLRAAILLITFCIAYKYMHDWGFTPEREKNVKDAATELVGTAVQFGRNMPVARWMMLTAPVLSGINFFAFYAMQPYLLELYGAETAYGISGLAAAIVAGAQIVGGMLVPWVRARFRSRTAVILNGVMIATLSLVLIGITTQFVVAIGLLCIWGMAFAITQPVRQAYLNDFIPTKQRATLLSVDSLLGSSGGVVLQPLLGYVADRVGYSASFVGAGLTQLLAAPLVLLASQSDSQTDQIKKTT